MTEAKSKTPDQLLSEPFAPELLREHPTKNITYVPGAEVVARLNRVFGVGGWSNQIIDRWSDGEQKTDTGVYPKWVMVHVRLIAGDRTADGIGGQEVKMLRNGTGPVDLGDEWKGAATDALKKAAQSLGVGLDLARKDEALLWEERYLQPKADEAVMGRIAAALDLMADEKARKKAKGDYFRRYGRPDELLARDVAEAVAFVEVATGTSLTGDAVPDEKPASPPETPAEAPEPPAGASSTPEPSPPATKAALDDLKAKVLERDEAGQESFKAWWRDNVGVGMDSGLVTIDQYEQAVAYLAG